MSSLNVACQIFCPVFSDWWLNRQLWRGFRVKTVTTRFSQKIASYKAQLGSKNAPGKKWRYVVVDVVVVVTGPKIGPQNRLIEGSLGSKRGSFWGHQAHLGGQSMSRNWTSLLDWKSEQQHLKKALRVIVLCCSQPSTVFISFFIEIKSSCISIFYDLNVFGTKLLSVEN